MKRPSFQFYPNDWRSDPALRMCSSGARGLWIDMLCLMHEGTPYGHLTHREKDILPEVLARLTGNAISDIETWLCELLEHGVAQKNDGGTIYSRRMVRDEEVRQVRAAGGVKSLKHPNVPKKKKGRPSRTSLKGSPSSSSSSSNTTPTPSGQDADVERVVAYYCAVHPKRKVIGDKPRALIRKGLENFSAADLCAAIDGNANDEWHRERRKYELSYVLRNAEKISEFLDKSGAPAPKATYGDKPKRPGVTSAMIDW